MQDLNLDSKKQFKAIKRSLVALTLLPLFVGTTALAEQPGDYRFPRECAMTPNGYPVPLCGMPLTKTPVVVKQEGPPSKNIPSTSCLNKKSSRRMR